jgi:hypothetical protein
MGLVGRILSFAVLPEINSPIKSAIPYFNAAANNVVSDAIPFCS